MSDKAIEAFRNSIKNSTETDEVKKVREAMTAMNKEILIGFPLELRIRSILGMISRMEDKSNLNYDSINEIIHANIGEYDYNILPEVHTVEEIENILWDIGNSIFMNTNYRKCTCKKCKDDFYLTFGEVEFYQRKEFKMPKMCPYCKKGIEKPKKVEIKKEEPVIEEKLPTAMEIAMKKAGL